MNLLTQIWNWLFGAKTNATIIPMTTEPRQTVPQTESVNRWQLFFGSIKTYEEANPANNNPYNFRYYFGGYLPKYGVVKESSGGFAMFESLALGELYGQTCIIEMVQNHPEWNFLDFFTRFAPPSDGNDTSLYAATVAKWCGTVPTTILSTFLGPVELAS